MITSIELRTKRRVIIEPSAEVPTTLHVRLDEAQQGHEWWYPWAGLRCKVVDGGARLVVKDDCVMFDGKHVLIQAVHLFFSGLCALALSLLLDRTNYPLLVNWAFLFIASVLLSLLVKTWRQWQLSGIIAIENVTPLQELQLGHSGHLYLPQNIFSVYSEVRSTGGSLSFGQWQQPRRLHLTLRLSGHAVVDGRHSDLASLSVFTGVGTGCVKNIRAMESLVIVSMSALHRPSDAHSSDKPKLVPSRYLIDLQYDELWCRVDIGASASRYGITLNGLPPRPFSTHGPLDDDDDDGQNIFMRKFFVENEVTLNS